MAFYQCRDINILILKGNRKINIDKYNKIRKKTVWKEKDESIHFHILLI